MSKTLRTEDDSHQDIDIPIYKNFKNIKDGLVILWGEKKKDIGYRDGKISDGDGNEVTYDLKISRKALNAYKRLKRIAKGSMMWLLGEFKEGHLDFSDGGLKEDFIRPDLLE